MITDATLTVEDIAKMLGVTVDTVRRWLRSGELKGYKLARKSGWRVRQDDLEEFVKVRSGQQAKEGLAP